MNNIEYIEANYDISNRHNKHIAIRTGNDIVFSNAINEIVEHINDLRNIFNSLSTDVDVLKHHTSVSGNYVGNRRLSEEVIAIKDELNTTEDCSFSKNGLDSELVSKMPWGENIKTADDYINIEEEGFKQQKDKKKQSKKKGDKSDGI